MISSPIKSQQQGQALAEFTIVASLILVPAFLMLPVMGKYMETQHKSQEAARYASWERSVWLADYADGVPQRITKSDNQIGHEITARILAEGDQRIDSNQGAFDDSLSLDPILYAYNPETEQRELLIDADGDEPLYVNVSASSGRINGPYSTAIDLTVGNLSRFTDFDVNVNGFVSSQASIKMKDLSWLSAFDWSNNGLAAPFEISSNHSMLTDGWNAGGPSHQDRTVSALVPLDMFEPLLNNVVTTGLSYVPWLSYLDDIELGIVEHDAVPNQDPNPNRVLKD
ncbi:hypothetical protein ACFSJ3_15200 [Corallincola platygyrae]|uniref:Pilus assembly protein n=1 Tax=Corallincola platygyrae TaxID=1193278 RepID=A0ABW4XS80_9GAMM